MDPKQFGLFLSEERKAKNLTQKELAEKLGVTDKAISKWERGICLPDVAKFDDIAAALDLTDIEVLRAHRLPPQEAKAEEKTPPFVTRKQAGGLLLCWLIISVAVYPADLLEMAGVIGIVPFGAVLQFPLTAVFATWLGLRHAEGVRRVDRREIGICWLLILVSLLLTFFFWTAAPRPFYDIMDTPARLLGANRLELQDYFFGGAFRWDLRWQFYWFLCIRFFSPCTLYTLVEAFAFYALAKRLKISLNARRQTNG